MPDRPSPGISKRKQPRQARSNDLVAAILQAATQVLADGGPERFTTARVAERAGVSIGSLYQYFPNKAAILFQLQSDEWRDTTTLLAGILLDRETAPDDRLRAAVHAFVRSECAEAEMRRALDEAAPTYRDAPEAAEPHFAGTRAFQDFLRAALPATPEAELRVAGEIIAMTLAEVGERISETVRTEAAMNASAGALADMLCAYLGHLGGGAAMVAPS
ncbi:TetR family transcriptional regulator [Methylobacterium sp. A49B]|uniref:TetR/AcrR family transcriptional regulator n=1 Tax=Methylobacterium mesophilicum SR1.6/6 TaxID=908290 RepID=A0A6B9FQW0_9HYPH|nr:TetR family transcriptional regulator [Methylobacterium mesophilicum]QGY04970.1 TetR/AcrR family transcriptional regulator [Methylobacterium mesophilicum SR1.6/6]